MSKLPKLRFPEFRDKGDWEEKNFSELVIEYKLGGNYSNSEIKTKFPLIKMGNISRGKINLNKLEYITTDENIDEIDKIQYGDLFFNTRNTLDLVGKVAIWRNELQVAYYNSNLMYLKFDNNFFMNYKLNSHAVIRAFKAIATGSTSVAAIYTKNLLKVDLSTPSVKEQQKIANCLTSLDKLITSHTQKLDTLKAHKKGLMQQLFPAEGKTVPNTRFPEFRDAGGWEAKPLKKVFSIFQGFAFSSKDSVTEGTRWLKIADVSIQEMNHSTPSYLPAGYKVKYKKFLVKQGDYVIALTRPILSKQLKMASVDKVFHDALLNQRVGKVVTNQNISFVCFLLQTSQLISNIETGISGSEPPNLSAKQIENINTRIPSATEQQKIANCLTSLDQLITAQANKIDTLKAHKKGLMQQLFPSTEEVDG